MKTKLQKLTVSALTVFALALPLMAQENHGTLGREDHILLTVSGTITDIDYTNREVTLKGPQGRTETFVV